MSNNIQRSADTDDDGSGTTGTIHNNAWKTDIYNAIDAALIDVDLISPTGTQNNYAVAQYGATTLRWGGTAAVTFTGFTNGVDGRMVKVINATASYTLKFTHEGTGSTAANRFICESLNGQILGPNGTALLIYSTGDARWRVFCLSPGTPITPTYNQNDFFGSGGLTWTVGSGDIAAYCYQQRGRTVRIWLELITTTTGGTANAQLNCNVPGGFTIGRSTRAQGEWAEGSGSTVGSLLLNAVSGTTSIGLLKTPSSAGRPNWSNAQTDTLYLGGQIEIEVS